MRTAKSSHLMTQSVRKYRLSPKINQIEALVPTLFQKTLETSPEGPKLPL